MLQQPRSLVVSLSFAAALAALASPALRAVDPAASLKEGTPELKSAGPLAFGPAGILFVADPLGASIFALDVAEKGPASSPFAAIKVEGIDEKIAALLGTSVKDLSINDLAVSPTSGAAYLSISRGLGPNPIPVIVRVLAGGEIKAISLEKIRFAKASIPDAPGTKVASSSGSGTPGAGDQKAKRPPRGNPRQESITDLAFVDGKLLVAGLSNEEFSSTLRSIPFPFQDVVRGTTVEIYHASHGALETHSPVRTFVPFEIAGEAHLFAAYTCTPLVTFPIARLQPGAQVKGKTVAELGNRNRPLDMVVYHKDGKQFLLIANSSRGVMKVSTENVEKFASLTEPVKDGGTKGLPYDTVKEWKGIEQLDRFDDARAMVVRRSEAGALSLETLPLP